MDDYHQRKIEFVSHRTGSSVLHVNAVALVAPASLLLFKCRQSPRLLVQWMMLVLPLLLALTFFAAAPLLLAALLAVPACLLPSQSIQLPSYTSHPTLHLPALSLYRAHLVLITVLSILAVDFPLFPRFLAKSESFGLSLVRAPLPPFLIYFTTPRWTSA